MNRERERERTQTDAAARRLSGNGDGINNNFHIATDSFFVGKKASNKRHQGKCNF